MNLLNLLNMRLKLFSLFLLLFFLWNGCKKDFDFDRLDNAEATGEWGIPLVNATYSIEDILSQLNENDYITQSPDGNIFLSYFFEENNLVTDSMILSFSNVSRNYEWQRNIYTPDGGSFSKDTIFLLKIPDDNMIVRSGVIMHGYLHLNTSKNISSVIVSCPSIKDASGNIFTKEFSDNGQEKIDLRGYRIDFNYVDTNTLIFNVVFEIEGQGGFHDYYVNINVSTDNLRLKEATGKIKAYNHSFIDHINIGQLTNNDNYGGSFTLYNPHIALHIKNSFNYLGGNVSVDGLYLAGHGSSISEVLANYPILIQISPGMDDELNLESISSVFFSSEFNQLNFKGEVTINPLGYDAGEVSIKENSSLDVKLNMALPFDMNVDDLFYHDIVNFSMDSVSMYDLIENITFQCILKNGLPISLNAQVYFYNSMQMRIIDSLFTPQLTLTGAYQEGIFTETTKAIEVDQKRVNRILAADKIIFRFRVNTDGKRVVIDAKNSVQVKLSMKLKYDTQNFPLSNLNID